MTRYLNGQHALEKIPIKENISRKECKRVLTAMEKYVCTVSFFLFLFVSFCFFLFFLLLLGFVILLSSCFVSLVAFVCFVLVRISHMIVLVREEGGGLESALSTQKTLDIYFLSSSYA